MSILTFIKKVCVQTAVYWGLPVNDGMGGYSYAQPREIKVRWDNARSVIKTKEGDEIETDAEIIIQEELSVNGRIWLGTLAELGYTESTPESGSNSGSSSGSSGGAIEYNTPDSVDSHLILHIEKTPLFRSTDKFVYFAKTRKS